MTSAGPRWRSAVTLMFAEPIEHTGAKDTTLLQAVKWFTQIRKAIEDDPANVGGQELGVDIQQMQTPVNTSTRGVFWRNLVKQIKTLSAEAAQVAGERLKDDLRVKYWNGLPPGLTLILLTHGVVEEFEIRGPKDGNPPDEGFDDKRSKKSGGIAFTAQDRTRALGEPAHEWMLAAHLSNMKVVGDEVVFKPDHRESKEQYHRFFTADSEIFVDVVNALRQSVFDRIYLAACGDDAGRLSQFSKFLGELTGKVIYFNTSPMDFRWTLGPKTVFTVMIGDTFPTQGKRFTQPNGQSVTLKIKGDKFLPGSNERVGRELATPVLDMSKAKVIREIQGVFKLTVSGFKNVSGLKSDWDQKTEQGFSDWLENNVPGFQGEEQLLFRQQGPRRFPSSRGAIVIFRDAQVHFRKTNSRSVADKKAMKEFPTLGAFERDTDGIGGGETIPPKLVP